MKQKLLTPLTQAEIQDFPYAFRLCLASACATHKDFATFLSRLKGETR
jgi:hypothetical protein